MKKRRIETEPTVERGRRNKRRKFTSKVHKG